jgi:hypothetical protein
VKRNLWSRGLTSSLLLVALLLGGCGGGTGAGTAPRPFSEVQASDLSFEADATFPGRGIFHVTTTEPMICAIVWGEDESFGNFNNSLAMNGTGIVQHDVFLPGAAPGVAYKFVVEGTTADGTLYRSDVGTFVIPESATTSAPQDTRPDLALGAKVTQVSSEFNSSYSADNAIDGDLNTEWSSAGDGNSASITIDLGTPAQVSGFEFITRSMADGSAVTKTYAVTVDGGDTLGPFPAGNPADPQAADANTTGQMFTFQVDTSSGGNTGALEIRILGQ